MAAPRVSIFKRSGENWYARFSFEGRQRKVALGTKNPTEAKRLGDELQAKLTLGQWSPEEPQGTAEDQPESITLKEAFELFVADQNGEGSTAHFANVKHHLGKFLCDRGEEKPLASITAKDVKEFVATITGSGLTVKTRNRYLASVSRFFRWAVDEGYLAESPANGVKFKKEKKGRLVYLTMEERDELIELAQDSKVYVETLLAAHAGLRASEVLRVRWEDIDFEQRFLVVEQTKNRNATTRTVPLTPTLHRELLRIRPEKAAGRLSRFPETHSGVTNMGRQIRAVAAKSDRLKGKATTHVLRHTFASLLAIAGVSLFKIQVWMGHENPKTTMIYAHLSPEHRAGIEVLG